MAASRPFFVIVPGATQNPTHYGYLAYLLQQAGYPTYSGLLPSVGASDKTTIEDDMAYIRDRMILPILDNEKHDVILVLHSYGGLPGGAAALGLSKKARLAQGKTTGVIGQIYYAALLQKGGDGMDVLTAVGGDLGPGFRVDPQANLIFCLDRIGPLYSDVSPTLADAAAASTMAQGLTSYQSPIPRASWDSEEYEDRLVYIRTVHDTGLPLFAQQAMIDSTSGVTWIIKDIESGHSPHLSQPKQFAEMLLALAKVFEEKP